MLLIKQLFLTNFGIPYNRFTSYKRLCSQQCAYYAYVTGGRCDERRFKSLLFKCFVLLIPLTSIEHNCRFVSNSNCIYRIAQLLNWTACTSARINHLSFQMKTENDGAASYACRDAVDDEIDVYTCHIMLAKLWIINWTASLHMAITSNN